MMLDVRIRPRVPLDDFGLSRCQAEVLAVLLSEDRWFTTWELYEKLRHSIGKPDVVKVFVFHLRRKLKKALNEPDDDCVRSQHSRGYTLTENTRARLMRWSSQHPQRVA